MGFGSRIRDPGSEHQDPEKTYSGSRIKKAPDPESRIRNTGFLRPMERLPLMQILSQWRYKDQADINEANRLM